MRCLVAISLVIIVAAGCSRPPLAHTRQSPDALAAAVVEALARGDRVRLDALALSEQEFRDYVWPSLPAARPERNLPFSYVWGDLRQKSQQALTGTLASHAGARYHVVGVRFEGVTDYGSYRVHRRATVHVRDASGATHEIQVCGSMIERDGAWKVFSYVTGS
jgi:hypothetical protein